MNKKKYILIYYIGNVSQLTVEATRVVHITLPGDNGSSSLKQLVVNQGTMKNITVIVPQVDNGNTQHNLYYSSLPK